MSAKKLEVRSIEVDGQPLRWVVVGYCTPAPWDQGTYSTREDAEAAKELVEFALTAAKAPAPAPDGVREALERAAFSIGVARDLALKELPASKSTLHTWTKAAEAIKRALAAPPQAPDELVEKMAEAFREDLDKILEIPENVAALYRNRKGA